MNAWNFNEWCSDKRLGVLLWLYHKFGLFFIINWYMRFLKVSPEKGLKESPRVSNSHYQQSNYSVITALKASALHLCCVLGPEELVL